MATTTIHCLIDVVHALASGSLHESLYLMDDNQPKGTPRIATSTLTTSVRKGDLLIWVDTLMEVETDAFMTSIWGIPPDICVPLYAANPETDVNYWYATIQRDFTGTVPYWIGFSVEGVPMTTPGSSSLVCGTNVPKGE